MMRALRFTVFPLLSLYVAAVAHAQYYKPHGASISAGYSGQFTTQLTASPSASSSTIGGLSQTVIGQQQFTPNTGGALLSLSDHPKPFLGIEINYGFYKSTEVYSFNYTTGGAQSLRVPVAVNEMTAAYEFHPKHIPLQPFLNIGGGAISFLPQLASNQWRTTGLVETGLDLPTHIPHVAVRIEGRALVYRAPNFTQPALSTRSWRVTTEPVAGLVYRF